MKQEIRVRGLMVSQIGYATDLGNTLGLYLFPLLRMARSSSKHPDQADWLETLRDFAYGFFVPGCGLNPFQLCPNGHFPRHGPLHFAGLWHGCNAIYGIAAALAREFADLFDDGAFHEIADGNLQWIAGLSAGLTREALGSCTSALTANSTAETS